MLKAKKTNLGISLFNPKGDGTKFVYLSNTSWEIIKAIKKYGNDNAPSHLMELFHISEENAKEDIQTVLSNLSVLEIRFDEIPDHFLTMKYAPRTVQFDITSRCNSKCIYCLSSDLMGHQQELKTQQIIATLQKLLQLDIYTLLLSGGEPFLRKDLYDILNVVKDADIVTWLYSNGMLINRQTAQKLSRYDNVHIQISLDSSVPEHHDNQRGVKGGFYKTLKGIKNLIETGKVTTIAMVITPLNYPDLEDTVSFLHGFGIQKIRIGTAWVQTGKGKNNKEKIFLDDATRKALGQRILEIEKQCKGVHISTAPDMFCYSKNPNLAFDVSICDAGRESLYISSRGDIYPCYTFAFPEFNAGNITKDDIIQVWQHSEIFARLREWSVNDCEKCKRCPAVQKCQGGCRGCAFASSHMLTTHDDSRCSYFLH